MDTTPNLGLPYIAAAQAQKHVTHNEALRILDAISHLSVLDTNRTAPPGAPSEGDRHIISSGATGDWTGKDNWLAAWQDGAWAFYEPREGWLARVKDDDEIIVWDGSAWVAAGGGTATVNPTPFVGINATADTTNRLSLNSPASLFNHDGTGHQQKINKNAAGNTASILFQTGFSGRAEFGTTGDDDWHVKVSPNGSTWHEALVADRNTGRVYLPQTPSPQNLLINPEMRINQRGFAGGALAGNTYGFDRWKAGGPGCTISVAADGTISLSNGNLLQIIEANFWGALAGLTFTISVEDPSAPLGGWFGAQNFAIPAGAGRRKTTVTLGAGETGNLQFAFSGPGTPVTFKRPKLEIGLEASAWMPRALQHEFDLCERYYVQYGGQGGANWQQIAPSFFNAPTDARVTMLFRNRMRASPTIAFHSDLSVYRMMRAGATTTAITALSGSGFPDGAAIFCTTTGGVAGEAGALAFNSNNNAVLILNAEL